MTVAALFVRSDFAQPQEIHALNRLDTSTRMKWMEKSSRIQTAIDYLLQRLRRNYTPKLAQMCRKLVYSQMVYRQYWLFMTQTDSLENCSQRLVKEGQDHADIMDTGEECELCNSQLDGCVVSCSRKMFHRKCLVQYVVPFVQRCLPIICPCGCDKADFISN